MSLTRLGLMAGSSLALAAVGFAGTALTPTAALAQTVTCVAGAAPLGSGASVIIPAVATNPGITCNYTGDTATVSTAGAFTVSASGGVPADPLVNGVNLRATGTDDINWTSTAGTLTGGAATNGPVIDAQTTGAGNINLTTGAVTPNAASGSDGIFARSFGTGNITLSTGAVGFGNAAGSTAIEAISNGGNIGITTNGAIGTNFSNLAVASSNHDGIVAQTSGAGTVSLDLRNSVTGYGPDGAAVRVMNGIGDVTISATAAIRGGNSGNANSAQIGAGLIIDSDGDVTIQTSSFIMGGLNPAGDGPAAIIAGAASLTLNFNGAPGVSADDIENYSASLGGIKGSGGVGGIQNTALFDEPAYTGGHVDFSDVSGGAEINFNTRSRWVVTNTSIMSPGNDGVNIDPSSILMTTYTKFEGNAGGMDPALMAPDVDQTYVVPGIVDFGDGSDVLTNRGRIFIGAVPVSVSGVGTERDTPPSQNYRVGMRGELRLLDLTEFVNSGDIWLGARFWGANDLAGTDVWADDMLYMPGAAFHGEDGSRIFMDVNLNATQSSCAPSTRNANGWLPAADCLGIQGGSATGRTELVLVDIVPGDRGSYNPEGLALVDLASSDPADTDPEAFFLSPNTARYTDTIGAGAIDKGLFFYAVGYDADTQQFKLFGQPGAAAQQLPIIATVASQLWRTATGGWFQRRVDQRDVQRDEGLGTGTWFSITGNNGARDVLTTIPYGLASADFDNSYDQNDVALSFGWDLIAHGSSAGSWTLGAMVGYAQSQVEFQGDNSANLEGVHGGTYGGWSFGGFFVDAAVNGTWVALDDDVPALNLTPVGTELGTNIQSLGAQVEAGWRWRSGSLWVEPLVGLSAVETTFDEFRIPNDDPDVNRPGGVVRLDASDSRRASAGVRVGLDDLMAGIAPASLSLTARRVNEFEGRSDVSIANSGPDAPVSDTLDGAFNQLTGSVSVSNDRRTISGYLNLDAVSGDDYESLGVSAGLRLQW